MYLSRGGRLYAPRGALTAGELWWRAPVRVYEVDVVAHSFGLSVEVSNAPGDRRAAVEVTAAWQVVDPVAVVRDRVSDVSALVYPRLVAALQAGAAETGWITWQGLASALRDQAVAPIGLPEGLRVDQIQAEVLPSDEVDAAEGA